MLSDVITTAMKDVNKTIGNEYAIITKVNTNQTVNLKPIDDDPELDDLINIPVLVNLDLAKNDKVVLGYLNNDINYPVVIGALNPKLATEAIEGRGIVTIEKVETDEFVDIYRITYDKAPIYSYFQVMNGGSETAEEVLTKLKTVDGTDSGLDADTLDGHHYNDITTLINNASLPAGIEVKELIEEKTVNTVGSVLFDNLDGDSVDKYVIEAKVTLDITVGDKFILLKPNGVNTNQRALRTYWGSSNGTDGFNKLITIGNVGGDGAKGLFKAELHSKTGYWREYNCALQEKTTDPTGRVFGQDIRGAWENDVDNITSLLLDGECTFSGTIKLYKVYDSV